MSLIRTLGTHIRTMGRRAAVLAGEVGALRPGPLPVPAMIRNGCIICSSFLTFLLTGHAEAAAIAAVFVNFLCLSDRATTLKTRIWVQVIQATLSISAGAIGVLIAGNDPLIMVTIFAFALFAGFVQGTKPGVEAIPRFSIICFVAAAYLPVGSGEDFAAVVVASAFAITGVWLDDYIRNGRRGVRIARINATVSYPGPRFSVAYGIASVCGLGIGLLWGQSRPYWVTITTLVVMQPDRRANMVRALQRFIGTMLGVIFAFAVVNVMPTGFRPAGLLGFALILPFVWPYGFDRNYGLGVSLMSLWVLLLIDFALPADDLAVPVFLSRLTDTAIGCAVAMAGSLLVYESRDA